MHNRVFDVMINLQSSAVICTFLNQEGGAEKSCTVTYYQSESDGCTVEGADVAVQSSLTRQTAQNTSNTVIVGVPFVDSIPIDSQTRYCLVVMASNGSHTANVLGSFNKGIYDIVTLKQLLSKALILTRYIIYNYMHAKTRT